MQEKKNSVGRIVAGCCMPIFWSGAIGFAYPGVMSTYWQELFSVGSSETSLVVTLMLLSISICTFFTGKFLNRFGIRNCILTGTIIELAAMAVLFQSKAMTMVYVWGFAINAGASFIYGPALTTVQQAMPQRKGVASGLLNLTFGLSGAIMTPVWERILNASGYRAVNVSLIICILITNVIAMILVRTPASPESAAKEAGDRNAASAEASALTSGQAVRTRSFWMIWLTWAFVGAAGISMVTLSKSYAIWLGLSGVTVLMAFNLTNGIGRIIAGWLTDAIGGEKTALIAFLIAAAGYVLLPFTGQLVSICILVACIGYGFGTMFAVTGPVAVKHFGMKHFSSIFGLIFTAYGCVGGIIGPYIAGVILERSGNPYRIIFAYLAVFALLGAVFMMILGRTKPEAES